MPKVKPTTAELKAEVELQLSQRRFILEAITASSTLLQVPVITAFVWYYLSRTNASLGALNKAILASELAPIVGDIQFPEGVLLGAAMESTEDFLKILEGFNIIDSAKEVVDQARESAIDTGEFVAEALVTVLPSPNVTCDKLNNALWNAHLKATNRAEESPGVAGPKGSGNISGLEQGFWTVQFGLILKEIKVKGCDRPKHPYFVTEEMWDKI